MFKNPRNKKVLKWSLVTAGVLLLIGAAVYLYFATLSHDDTASLKADYTVEAIPFIKEFEKDYKTANKKYAEKIIAVKGIVTTVEPADTTMNIKMADTTTGSYLIFAFQDQHMAEAKKLKPGENVLIKGSCSDGIYSDILGTYFVSFKRSTVEKVNSLVNK
jgi:tRNA_anti-like